MDQKNTITLTMFVLALTLLVGCQTPAGTPLSSGTVEQPEETTQPEQATQPGIANPASGNCTKQGGTLTIEARGDGGQFGVCYFVDNRQCEEWALMNGDCPVDGVKVTGYTTPAARYCAITGGEYAITSSGGAEDEQGTCTFNDGSQCDAWDYYNGACTPGATISPAEPAVEWQTYTNSEAGFSLQTPSTWSQATLPDQYDGAIHGEGFTGPEGGVEVYWGIGFGGACPIGIQPVQLAEGEVPACYVKNSDGTEEWNQISHEESGGNYFSARAYTSDVQQYSHDLVLQVLATLTFMPVTQPQAGEAFQPLSVEVCNGQAQAMSHTLNDLVPTQSEEPLDDPVTGASGTGCQATITGTGLHFESPTAVVDDLGGMLEEQNWTADPMLAADGPTGTAKGYRKGDQICWAGAMWRPDESANCPQDQPISACPVTPEQQIYTVTLTCGVEIPQGQPPPR